MTISFAIVEADGTTASVDPRLDAYQYMARLRAQGRGVSLLVEDNTFAVSSDGLMTLKFVPMDWTRRAPSCATDACPDNCADCHVPYPHLGAEG